MQFREEDIDELIRAFPRLRRRPTPTSGHAVVSGSIHFEASSSGKPTITDEYRIRIEVPLKSPQSFPNVFEVGKRIPPHEDNHVNGTGNLCLGSPLRLLQILGPKPTLVSFVDKCVVPFLYAASWRERGLPGFPFDELAHGEQGLVHDYERLFSVAGAEKVATTLQLLGIPKRVANKQPCCCGCGRRLARCSMHVRLAPFRNLAPRSFYAGQAKIVLAWITKNTPPHQSLPAIDLQRLVKLGRCVSVKGTPLLISRSK